MRITSPPNRTPNPGNPAWRQAQPGEEAGFALIAVILLSSVLLTLALLAFGETGINRNGSSRADTALEADAAASAGLSDSLYDIAGGNFACSLSRSGLLSSSGLVPNVGVNGYTVNVTYYSADWTPGSAPGPASACPTGGVVPAAAMVSSTGSSTLDGFTSTETITEHLAISVATQAYLAFSASNTGLDLSNLQVTQPPGATATSQGVIYTNGPISQSGPSCGPSSPWATVVAFGSSTLNGCNVGGSIILGNGNLTLANTPVGGNVTVRGGGVVMGGSNVSGNVAASGNVKVCGSGPTPSWCSGIPTAASTIYGSATAASGAVWINNAEIPSNSSSPPCSATSMNGVTIDGCVTSGAGTAVNSSAPLSLPAMGNPSPAAWSAAGYPTDESATCSGGVNTTGSVAYDLAHLTANTLIVANCPGTGVNLSNLGPISLGSTGNPGTNYSAAVFVTGGITLGGSTTFTPAGPGSAQLSLIVPEPSGFNSSSCNSSYNINDSAGATTRGGAAAFFYTPCTFADSGGGQLTGEIVAGSISLSKPLTMTDSSFTPPGLAFAYQAQIEARRITQL